MDDPVPLPGGEHVGRNIREGGVLRCSDDNMSTSEMRHAVSKEMSDQTSGQTE